MTARLSSVLIARPKDTSTVIHFGHYLITGALITLIPLVISMLIGRIVLC